MTISRECYLCHKSFFIKLGRLKHGRGLYCSLKCRYEHMGILRRDRITLVCWQCVEEYEVPPSRLNQKGGGKFCSKQCRIDYFVGAQSPSWVGGSSRFRGPTWYRHRMAALKRDAYICRDCGMTNHEHVTKYKRRLHVHHIVPYRYMATAAEANQLSNLVTLCAACHDERDDLDSLIAVLVAYESASASVAY